MKYTYEVVVTEDHWREGCEYVALATENASECCPVYRAMAEAGLPVASVFQYGWHRLSSGVRRHLPREASDAISLFDDYRLGERGILPEPLTFYVDLEA